MILKKKLFQFLCLQFSFFQICCPVSDSTIFLTDSLLLIFFWGKLGVSGMLLMGFLGAFTRSIENDCLVSSVAKVKSLAGRLEYSNRSILTSTMLSITWYESSFYDLSLNDKFINFVVNVFFASIFVIYRFYQFILNLVQIGAFMLFPQMINNIRWPITATTIRKGTTINREHFTNKKDLLTSKKDLLPYKQDLLTYNKKDFLTYTKTHGK